MLPQVCNQQNLECGNATGPMAPIRPQMNYNEKDGVEGGKPIGSKKLK